MAKLAIVSSYNENCGNASYTHVLKNEFSRHIDVDVISLDLFTLQKQGRTAKRLGDEHIREICRRLKDYDYVNIQFEAGLYGATISDMLRRVSWLIGASSNLIFTMHRIDLMTRTRGEIILDHVKRRKFRGIMPALGRTGFERLYFDLIAKCKEQSKRKNLWVCVHTRRERRIVQEYYKMANCFDHPLAFLTPDERDKAWSRSDKVAFKAKYRFKPDTCVVGLFGYLSEYKGLETAINALPLLPENYIIALFGSQHPQSIREGVPIDPYLSKLVEIVDDLADDVVDKQLIRVSKLPKSAAAKLDAEWLAKLTQLQFRDRVRFMGNIDDPEFIEALRLCDAVVLPYMEVGQSMSGVIALAIESGATMFCSNNLSFFEAKKYYGEIYHNFDIGNHVELAQKLLGGGDSFRDRRNEVFRKYNINTLVTSHMEKFGYRESGV